MKPEVRRLIERVVTRALTAGPAAIDDGLPPHLRPEALRRFEERRATAGYEGARGA